MSCINKFGDSTHCAVKRIFLVLMMTGQALAGDSSAPDFSKYPKSTGFDYFVECHRSGKSWVDHDPAKRPLVAISHFWQDSGSGALDYFVTTTGSVSSHRTLFSWAVQSSRFSQLNAKQLTQLKTALKQLPRVNSYPPFGQLVIISFRDGKAWTTRTCRPEDVQSIYAIIGERYETARPTE